MKLLLEAIRRLRGLIRSGAIEAEMDEEMRFHIDRQTEKNLRLGMTPGEARRNAMVKFGGMERMKEDARDEVRPMVLEDATRDLRFGLRALLRNPAFALVAVLTLGLGIGASTSVFSVVRGVLLKPLPYEQADRLVRLYQIDADNNRSSSISFANYADWKAQTRGFSALAAMQQFGPSVILANGESQRVVLSAVSREFFDVLRVKPVQGRAFMPEEQHPGAARTVLVGHEYWQTRLGSRADFGAMSVRINDQIYQVIGVMPRGFDYPGGTSIWMPTELQEPSPARTAHNYQVVGRLRDDIALEEANRELSTVSRALKAQYGDESWMVDAVSVPLLEQMTSSARPVLLILLGAALLLLLIACANVSNLLLARNAARQRELAVRFALGASGWRVARQLLAESLVLSLSAATVGMVSAIWGTRALLALEPGSLPRIGEVGIDFGVLLFAFVVALAMAALLSLITMARIRRQDLRDSMTQGTRNASSGRASQHLRDALVIAQVAFTIVLLIGAGLLMRSFVTLLAVNPGFSTQNALMVDLIMPFAENAELGTRQIAFQNQLMERIRSMPGITGVGLINDFPMGGGVYRNGQFIEMSRPDEITSYEQFAALGPAEIKARAGQAGYRIASAEYFRTMSIPLIRGRLFEPSDVIDQPHVAVISESLAKSKWPNQDPIGKFIQYGNMDGDVRAFRVIGMVGDVREFSPETPPGPLFYGNYAQRPAQAGRFTLVVRGPRAVESGGAIQRTVSQMNPNLPVELRTMEQAMDSTLAGRRFSLLLIAVFGAAALVLATFGIYGVISYLVAQRTREIGIRMALGADARTLVRMIVGRGARLAAIGVALGAVTALGMSKVISGMLYGVKMTDPIAFAAVITLVGGAVLLASYIPARRALAVPPVITLRSE